MKISGGVMLTSISPRELKSVAVPVISREEHPLYKGLYKILHFSFVALPVLAGVDKFSDFLVKWPAYLSPQVSGKMINIQVFLNAVGAIEIALGGIVAMHPKYGAFMLAIWLGLICLNLSTIPADHDLLVRCCNLCVGALAFGFIAKEFVKKKKADDI